MEFVNPNKKYYSNYNTVFSCQYHVIFTPKYRRRVLIDGVDIRLKDLIMQNQTKFEYQIIELEIMPDHVHLLIEISPMHSVKQIVARIKGLTANILRKEFPYLKTKIPTLWTRAFFVSTVGAVSLDVIKNYIENQKEV